MNSSHLSSKIILCIFLVIFPLTTISAQIPKANFLDFQVCQWIHKKFISDFVKEIFGWSSYFHLGFYDKINLKGRETDFSFLVGKTHFNSFGFVLTNGTQIPLKLKNKNLKLYLISKATLMHKAKDKYTGFNSSKIIRNHSLIKRRQTIIVQFKNI